VHGANDISNAIGPYATIYQIWSSGTLPEKGKSAVPLWILGFGGAALVIGLWTYGYNIMRNLGNKVTLHSPSRGFSMELGSAITVILATRLSKSSPLISVFDGHLANRENRASRLHHTVHHRRDRRRRPLLGHVENNQLAHGGVDLRRLDYHSARRRHHRRLPDGHHHQRPEVGYGGLSVFLLYLTAPTCDVPRIRGEGMVEEPVEMYNQASR